MASTSKTTARSTGLKGKKEEFDFEVWVEIDGKPLEVYGVNQGDDGVPAEAWIASEGGKVRTWIVNAANTWSHSAIIHLE